MEQGARRGCEICAGNQIGDCQGRFRRESERMERGGEEGLSGLGRIAKDTFNVDASATD